MIVWRDGQLLEEEASAPPPWVGWGVFTTVGCDHGRPLLWDRHQARLAGSVELVAPGLESELPGAKELTAVLEGNHLGGPARLRLVVRRRAPAAPWSVEATAAPAATSGPGAAPVRLATVRWQNAPAWAGHKTLARLAWDDARRRVQRAGADDALLVDGADRVLETSIANLLARFGTTVVTPPAPTRCLPGVLRGWLLEHLGALGLATEERDLTRVELAAADELWVSNAVIGVRRVVALDDHSWTAWPRFEHLARLGLPAPGWPFGE